ncbi:hypothetical protein [Paenibacillus popilliae]|uniref:Uncharacterized protein n=1 Tax=Paenibacillus popilliae ATCC 14706 TaxID=1212764 RepID=M9LCL2_PAEPP|nr:hypothetical protein [Paenibacillus popilliae]GAC43887.1 hypothetical protein PPOP_3287 [Paenibacillus popilliae ATCC 14706]
MGAKKVKSSEVLRLIENDALKMNKAKHRPLSQAVNPRYNMFEDYMRQFDYSIQEVKRSIDQLAIGMEGGEMRDDVTKMGQKLEDINKNVHGLSINVAKLETEIKIRFEQSDKTLQAINSKLDTLITKEEFDKKTEQGRFNITTVITIIGTIAALVAAMKAFM